MSEFPFCASEWVAHVRTLSGVPACSWSRVLGGDEAMVRPLGGELQARNVTFGEILLGSSTEDTEGTEVWSAGIYPQMRQMEQMGGRRVLVSCGRAPRLHALPQSHFVAPSAHDGAASGGRPCSSGSHPPRAPRAPRFGALESIRRCGRWEAGVCWWKSSTEDTEDTEVWSAGIYPQMRQMEQMGGLAVTGTPS